MQEFLSSLKLQTFVVIGYVFPGTLLVVSLFNIIFEVSIANLASNIIFILLSGFVVGILLHSLYSYIENILWWPYHTLKEKNANGSGVKYPTTTRGKLVLMYRIFLFGRELHKELGKQSKTLIEAKYGLIGLNGLEEFYIKENQFILNQKIAEYYEHLSYNKIFCSSSSVSFLIIAIATFIKAQNSDLVLKINDNIIYNWHYMTIWLIITCLVSSYLFFKRSIFYKNYRTQVLNANIITTLI